MITDCDRALGLFHDLLVWYVSLGVDEVRWTDEDLIDDYNGYSFTAQDLIRARAWADLNCSAPLSVSDIDMLAQLIANARAGK